MRLNYSMSKVSNSREKETETFEQLEILRIGILRIIKSNMIVSYLSVYREIFGTCMMSSYGT